MTSKNTQLIENLTKDVLYNSLAQAIIRLIKTPYLTLRLILSLFILSTTCLASYMVFNSMASYLSFEVVTTVRTLHETSSLFPKITICNINPFTTEYALNYLQGINSSWNIFSLEMNNLTLDQKILFLDEFYHYFISTVNEKSFSVENRKKLSHSLEDILLNCSFNDQPCGSHDFTYKFDPYYGNCFEFNTGFDEFGNIVTLRQTTLTGSTYGLHLEFYVNMHENLTLFNSLNSALGLLVRVGNSSYLTDYGLDGIRISPGFLTDIVLDRTYKQILPKPYSNCEIQAWVHTFI